jgi:hypothetical protein
MQQATFRQGDVLLTKIDKDVDLSTAKPIKPRNGRLILAEGEATGHHHSVDCQTAGLFDLTGKTVLVVSEPTTLDHQEHGTIEIAPGQYWVTRQREYQPNALPRPVLD